MLAVSPLRNITSSKDEKQGEVESTYGNEEFPDFSAGNVLESIDFDDLFVGISDGDVLPDLEMDPEILAEFSVSVNGEELVINTSVSSGGKANEDPRKEEEDKVSDSESGLDSSLSTRGEEIVSKRDESVVLNPSLLPNKDGDKGRKSSSQTKNNQGKRKVKVDWTPELHRRFVQAVEQLGVDKAVPSRILELMGIDCLTRHNIASHLQKYRSHRKHMLAREAEAASWSQRRQMFGGGTAVGGGKRDISHWHVPIMGFPPMSPMHHHFRPLHVWGHPSMEQSLIHMWPKHLAHSPSPPPPPPTWPPPPTTTDPSYWHYYYYHHHHYHQQRIPNGLTPGTPCFPQPLPVTRFGAAPVPGIPPHAMYKVDPGVGFPTGQSAPPHPLLDFHPSKESVDAAIGDALSKPWLPLPLGLKPPSVDSVVVELQRQGISKIPPTCA